MLAQLQGDIPGLLDPQVVGVFLEHVTHQSHGRRVRLSNGQVGRVIFIPDNDPARPIVEIGPEIVDLRDRPDLTLVEDLDER